MIKKNPSLPRIDGRRFSETGIYWNVYQLLKRDVWLLLAIGLCLLSTSTQANNVPPIFISEDSQSFFRINRHSNDDLAENVVTANKSWTVGWSHLRYFKTTEDHFVLLVKNKNGKLHVRKVNSDGSLGSTPGTWTFASDVTSVDILYPNGDPVLMLHVRSSGRLILRRLNANGSIGSAITDNTFPGLVRKDIVRPYKVGNHWYLFAYARFYGGMDVYALRTDGSLANGAFPDYQDRWTKGWSNVEFYETGGQTLVILYKDADVFGQQEGGKIGVKRINADGSIPQEWHQRPGDGVWTKGYTEFRIFRKPAVSDAVKDLTTSSNPVHQSNKKAPLPRLAIAADPDRSVQNDPDGELFLMIYKVGSGAAKTLRLGSSGIGEQIYAGTISSGWKDMAPMYVNGNFYLAKVNEDSQSRSLSPAMTERFADVVRNSCPETMGFQFALSQHGQLQHIEAGGFAKKTATIETPMFATHKIDTASVGKMMTAFAFLKMVDSGIVGLHDPMLTHLPADVEQADHADYYFLDEDSQMKSTVSDVRLSELATYTSRFGQSSSGNVLAVDRNQPACATNNLNSPNWVPNPYYRCNSGYQNSAFGMLGFALMNRVGLPLGPSEGSYQWQDYNHNLWMNDIHVDFECNDFVDDADSYVPCDDTTKACTNGLRRVDPVSAQYCLSGSWRSNTEDLMRFLWAIRYGKGLSKESHELLISQSLQEDAGVVRNVYFGWNGARAFEGITEKGLFKAGGTTGSSAYIYHLPYGIDAAIIRNVSGISSDSCTGVGDTLNQAFQAAID